MFKNEISVKMGQLQSAIAQTILKIQQCFIPFWKDLLILCTVEKEKY